MRDKQRQTGGAWRMSRGMVMNRVGGWEKWVREGEHSPYPHGTIGWENYSALIPSLLPCSPLVWDKQEA